jgi:hypothetical protein
LVHPDGETQRSADGDLASESLRLEAPRSPKQGERDVPSIQRKQRQQVDDRPSETYPLDVVHDDVGVVGSDRSFAKEQERGQAEQEDLG